MSNTEILEQKIKNLESEIKKLNELVNLLIKFKDETYIRMSRQDALNAETRRQLWIQGIEVPGY